MMQSVADVKAMMSTVGIRESVWLEIGGKNALSRMNSWIWGHKSLEKWIISTQVCPVKEEMNSGGIWGRWGLHGGCSQA